MHVYHTYEEAHENKDDREFLASFQDKGACLERYFRKKYNKFFVFNLKR